MTSTSTGGALPRAAWQPSAQVQADFFSKLARVESAVLSQQHPRYKLSPSEVQKLSAVLNQAPVSFPAQPESGPLTNGNTLHHAKASASDGKTSSSINFVGALPQKYSAAQATSAKTTSSGIDPVLLTKSEDLVKAELNLKRVRIERALKDSVSSSNKEPTRDTRDRELGSWLGAITIDAGKILELATTTVKPESGSRALVANEDSSVNSSEDERSYYSSQVNSWTRSPDGKDKGVERANAPAEPHNERTLGPGSNHQSGATVREPRVSGLGPRSEASVAFPADKLPPSNLQHADATDSSGQSRAFVRVAEDLREESYSPPGITHDQTLPSPRPALPQALPKQSLISERQPAWSQHVGNRTRESESYSPPPPPQVPIIANNNLTAPVAPQPSRISPIALGNLPQNMQNGSQPQKTSQQNRNNFKPEKQKERKAKFQQIRETKKAQIASSKQSKKASDQQAMAVSRKRRRGTETEDDIRRVSNQRGVGSPSPEPHIKQEPMSPPPLTGRSAAEPARRLVLRDDGRADIEIMSPRFAHRVRPQEQVYGRADGSTFFPALQQPSRYANQEPIVIDESDAPSPPVSVRRRPTRDDADLRRVASLHYAARPYTPVEYSSPRHEEAIQYNRPISRTVVDRPVSRQYDCYGQPAVQTPLQYRLQGRRTSPVFADDDYIPTNPQVNMPPPPKRRIVVDQYGNEYIAVPARPSMHRSVPRELPDYLDEPTSPYGMPPLRGQSMQAEPRFFQHRQPLRQQPLRQQHEVIELDDDEEDYRMMPPPQLVPRKRPVEGRGEHMAQPSYYQNQQAPRSASLQPLPPSNNTHYQYLPAQVPMWNQEVAPPPPVRERAYSARPNLAQQQDFYASTAPYGQGHGSNAWR